MNPDLHCLAYVSSAKREMTSPQLELLLRKTRLNNSTRALTGVLLYSGGNFLQVLEGPKAAVLETFNRIRLDKLHGDIIELTSEAPLSRQFAGWSMAYCAVTWESLMRIQAAFQPDLAPGTGMEMLKQSWSANRGSRHFRQLRTGPVARSPSAARAAHF